MRLKKLPNQQKKKLQLQKKRHNLKPKEKPSKFLKLLKKLNLNHLKQIINNHGTTEQELMLLEQLLQRFLLLNKQRKKLMFLRTKKVLMPLLKKLLKVKMKTPETEKDLKLTHGMNTG